MIELPNGALIRKLDQIYYVSQISNQNTFFIKYYNSKEIIVRNKNVELLKQCYNAIITELKKMDGEIIKLDYIKL